MHKHMQTVCTHIRAHTHRHVEKRTSASFARSNYPRSKAQRQLAGWRGGGNFPFFNVTHCLQDIHRHLKQRVSPPSQHINMTKLKKREVRGEVVSNWKTGKEHRGKVIAEQ